MGELQQLLLMLLGACVGLFFLVKCICFLKYFFPHLWNPVPPSFFQSMGEWAVITGSGDGIGKAYAFELAKRGLNIVLISRTLEKLQKIASEIEGTTGRSVKIIQADFSKNDIYEHIEESLQGLEIGILVNNVGMLPSTIPYRFLIGPNKDDELINVNVISLLKMTRMILKQMVPRQKGLILNLSSIFGTFPCPLFSSYSASKEYVPFETVGLEVIFLGKAFVYTFSKALQAEYKGKGIMIQAVAPFGVSTPMTNHIKPSLLTKTPEEFVRQSLDYVPLGDETYGCLAHEIMGRFLYFCPSWIFCNEKIQDLLTNRYIEKRGWEVCAGLAKNFNTGDFSSLSNSVLDNYTCQVTSKEPDDN